MLSEDSYSGKLLEEPSFRRRRWNSRRPPKYVSEEMSSGSYFVYFF